MSKIIITTLIIFLFALSLFYLVIQPARTVYWAIRAIHFPMPFEERGRLYQKALALSPLGARQIRESFTNEVKIWIQGGLNMPREFIDIISQEADILVSQHSGNIWVYIEVGNFYNALAERELKETGKYTEKAIGLLNRAEEIFVQGMKISPRYQKVYLGLAQNYLYRGNKDEAVKFLQQAVDLEPDHAESYWNLAEVYYFKGDFEKTKKNFEKALELGYGFQDAARFGELARAYFETEEYEKALLWYKKVVELNPDNAEAHYTLAIILRDSGRPEEARAEAEMVKKIKPEASQEMDKFMSEISN